MSKTVSLWLGQPDPHARLKQIEQLDPEQDNQQIVKLFYGDFTSIMLPQAFSGFMLTFAAPRMSRLLESTGEVEHRFAKRFVDTALLARTITTHGFESGPGRAAAHRVNSMHKHFDIHPDDFVIVGVDAALISIELAEKFGWRDVSDNERAAILRYFNRQARAFGSTRALPATRDEMREFWEQYMDTQLHFEPQNLRLATVALNWTLTLFPPPLRPLFRRVLLSNVDPRILNACAMSSPSAPARWLSDRMLRLVGKRDPLPDGIPDAFIPIIESVYPDGWSVDTLGPSMSRAN